MQTLTASPRGDLTDAQVLALLHHDTPTFDAGLELVTYDDDGTLTVEADLTEHLQPKGSQLVWAANTTDSTTTVNTDCTLVIDVELAWGVDLVRVWRSITAGGVTAKFYRGVYCLTSPDEPIGMDVTQFTVTGYDRLNLLQREVGDSYPVTAGSVVLDAVSDALTAAGVSGISIDPTAATVTLPTDKVWPLIPTDSGDPTRWIDIVNWLLAVINYDPLWCDENGLYRSQPHLDATTRTPEYVLDADNITTTIVGYTRTKTLDLWAAPNKWIFVQADYTGTPTEGAGIYTVTNDSDGPASITARGLTYPKQLTIAAADQATLTALGDAQVAADKAATVTFASFSTGSLPLAGNNDLITLNDTAAGGSMTLLATGWTEPLDGTDMTWNWTQVA